MKIRMKVQVSGTRDGQEWPGKGAEVDLPDDEAAQVCAAGLAEPVAGDEPEKAVLPAAETSDVEEPEKPAAPAAEKRAPGRPRKARTEG